MMECIKFRQWMGDCFEYWGFEYNKKRGTHGFTSPMSPALENYHCQQYIDMKDVNGVEIYAGDIAIWRVNGFDIIGEVYYETQGFDMRSPTRGYIGWDALRGTIEVIGNIYETPEAISGEFR